MDICAFCSKPASMECNRCGESYCGQVCQKAHWKSHRAVCVPMPTLVPSVKQTEDVAAPEDTKEIIEIFLSNDELTDTKQPIELSTTMEKVQKVEKSATEEPLRNDGPTIMPPGVVPDLTMASIVQTEKAAPLKPLSSEWRKTDTLLYITIFNAAKIRILNAYRGSRRPVWVTLEITQARLDELLSETKQGASSSQPPAKVEQNGLYIVHVDDNWHRAVALGSPRDNFVLVRFIDRGITEVVPMGDIREAWPALHEKRAFAFEVLLTTEPPSRVLDVGSILTVHLADLGPLKLLVVHEMIYPQPSMPEAIVACGVNEKIDLNVTNFLGKDRALVILRRVPSALMDAFMKLRVEAPDLPAWSKKSHLVVIDHKEYGWCRARILSTSREVMVIFLIDFGVIEHFEHLPTMKDCPEVFAQLPALTMCLSVQSKAIDEKDFYDKFRVGGELRFQLMPSGHSDSDEGTLCFEDIVIGQAKIRTFYADLKESCYGYWQQWPQNGTIVQILSVHVDDVPTVVICPADRVGRFEQIVQDIYSREQVSMVRLTKLTRYTDKVFVYKDKHENEEVSVRRLDILGGSTKIVHTMDLDSGKYRDLHFERLFRVPPALCHLPVDTLNVSLIDMPKNTCELDINRYLAPFIENKTLFRLVCGGGYHINGVELLHLSSNASVMSGYEFSCACQPENRCRLMPSESSSEELSTSDASD